MSGHRPSLRRVFARQFVVAAAVPLLALVLMWFAVALPDAVRLVQRENAEVAALTRGQIEAALAQPERMLRLVAARLGGRHLSTAQETSLLQQAVDSTPPMESMYVADAQGRVQIAAARPSAGVQASDLIGLDLSARHFFVTARERGALVWSDTFLSPLSGQVTAVLVVPAGERIAVAELSLAGLARELQPRNAAQGAVTILLDGKGRVIAHPRQQLASWQENLSQWPLVREALQGRPGAGEIELDGERWLASVATAQPTGWYVVVAQPRSRLYAPLIRLGAVLGISLLLALALATAMGWRLARRVTGHYQRLSQAAQALVDQPQAVPAAEFDHAETHELWERLRSLLDRLQDEERRARNAQRDLQSVLDAATEISIIATDDHGIIRLFNRGAEKMLGYRADEMLGRTPDLLHDPAEVAAHAREVSQRVGRPVSGLDVFVVTARQHGYEVRDWTYLCRDGTRLWVTLAITAVRDAAGKVIGYLGIAVDQTQRRRAGELDLARQRAEAASQAKTEFLSRVSHELRTPLNAMLGYAQLLSLDGQEALSEAQRDRVARIESAGWHLLRLIDDVLDLSGIESGRIQLAFEPVEVPVLLGEAMRLVAPQADERGVAVHLAPAAPGTEWLARADRTRLKQVFVNLLSNAVKYNGHDGRVEISLHDPGGARLAVRIADTGRGMDPGQLRRLFVPFDRLGLEGSDIPGTGIGLVITRRLVALMDGHIDVASVPAEGSTFTVTLPRAEAPPAPAPSAAPLPGAAKDAPALGEVVYVEDNALNAALMQEVFAMRPGCRLHLCATAAAGRDLIERLNPRLVLVDLHLPDGNGLDLLRWLRGDPRRARTPAIVVSADATRAQQEEALAAGARAYLTKPIRIIDALQAVDDALQANASA